MTLIRFAGHQCRLGALNLEVRARNVAIPRATSDGAEREALVAREELPAAGDGMAAQRARTDPAAQGRQQLEIAAGDLDRARAAADELERTQAKRELARALIELGALLRREGRRLAARGRLRRGPSPPGWTP